MEFATGNGALPALRGDLSAGLVAWWCGPGGARPQRDQPDGPCGDGWVEIDLSREFSKPFTDDAVRAPDVVITMRGGDACPFYPATGTSTGSSTTPPANGRPGGAQGFTSLSGVAGATGATCPP